MEFRWGRWGGGEAADLRPPAAAVSPDASRGDCGGCASSGAAAATFDAATASDPAGSVALSEGTGGADKRRVESFGEEFGLASGEACRCRAAERGGVGEGPRAAGEGDRETRPSASTSIFGQLHPTVGPKRWFIGSYAAGPGEACFSVGKREEPPKPQRGLRKILEDFTCSGV